MNLDLALRGSLAALPADAFDEAALMRELERHGLTPEDSRLALNKGLLEGYMARSDTGGFTRLTLKASGNLAGEAEEP